MQRTVEINGVKYVKQGSDFERQIANVSNLIGEEIGVALEKVGAIIAGGAVLSQFTHAEVSDVDVYFPSRQALIDAFLDITVDWTSVYLGHTDKSITLKDRETGATVQFIYFDYFKTAEQVFEAFDFTVCMAAIELKEDQEPELVLHPQFLSDVASRTLHFNNGTRYPYISLIRTRKYAEKGYQIGKGNLLAIGAACATKPISSWEEAKEQLGGVYGYQIDLQINDDKEFTQKALHEVLTNIREDSYIWQPHDYEDIFKELTGVDYNDYNARKEFLDAR